MGWKVAWSDRMIPSMVASGLLQFFGRHFAADQSAALVGIRSFAAPHYCGWGHTYVQRFRGDRSGLPLHQSMAGNLDEPRLSASFYAGDALGSFNSWMRIITGLLAGLGIVWFAFPHLEQSFAEG